MIGIRSDWLHQAVGVGGDDGTGVQGFATLVVVPTGGQTQTAREALAYF